MIGWIAARLLSVGVPERFKKAAAWFILVLVIVLALVIAKRIYDRNVIEDHTAKVDLTREKEDRKADNAAAEQRREDDARIVQEKQELKDVVNANPDPAIRKREFYRCIRLQQAARANGLEPPACV